MYYYIYDTFLSDPRYEKVIDRIKTRLLDLDIQGKHEKLTLLKSIDELIQDEVKRGVSTVIVVGNDQTFFKVIDIVAKNDLTLGLIPIGPNNNLAKSFGIKVEEEACEVLSARKVVKMDLGRFDNQYFFSSLKITKNLPRLSIQKDNFKVIPKPECIEVDIYNFYYEVNEKDLDQELINYSAQDREMELVIKKKRKNRQWFKKSERKYFIDTIIQGNKFKIESFEYLPVTVDGFKIVKTPLEVEIVPNKLKLIVGRDRLSNIQ